MTGIVDVGGGMRGAYGAGIFDWCLDNQISFDYLIGVSAGSANIASFLAGQRGRNHHFYTVYSLRKEYMSKTNLLKTGSYVDLEYIYGDGLSNSCGEYPLDWEGMVASGKKMKIVATDAFTALPIYYDMMDMSQDDYGAIKGSSCVPLASKPYVWKGHSLFDGGLSDPIPFEYAMDDGCDRVVIILTRPKDFYRTTSRDDKAARFLPRKYAASAKALAGRAYLYNHQLTQARELEKEGKALILAPYTIDGMETLCHDKNKIEWIYNLGYEDAEKLRSFLG